MRKWLLLICLMLLLPGNVLAMEETAPQPPKDAMELLPQEQHTFGEDLWTVISSALSALTPEIAASIKICGALFGVCMLSSLASAIPGKTVDTVHLVGILVVCGLLLETTGAMFQFASETITELSQYGKMLIPVLCAAMASSGGFHTSTTLYIGTAIFDTVLTSLISSWLIPMVSIMLILSVASAFTGEKILSSLREFLKWLVTWLLKMILYIFTGYIGITGVVSGNADAAAMKVTKLSMSGMVPVVGGILSDASEAVIVGAGVVKNALGTYGLLAVIAIWISPFLKIGAQYLLLKLTTALCEMFDAKPVNELMKSFTGAMGLLLGMTGAVCVMLLISTVCFMKGVA